MSRESTIIFSNKINYFHNHILCLFPSQSDLNVKGNKWCKQNKKKYQMKPITFNFI